MDKEENQEQQQKLLESLRDFTRKFKESWDKFIAIRSSNGKLDWYAEWPQFREPLLASLSTIPAPETSSSSPLQILVPVCSSSLELSEHLYDAGFHNITSIDLSKVVISDMLRRNVCSRPQMKWRFMDITKMQVHRVLKNGGKFICLTLSESHVLGTPFPKFRYGWRVGVLAIPLKPSNKPSIQTFMVIAEKKSTPMLHKITLSFDPISLSSKEEQVRGLSQAIETENKVRWELFNDSNILYTLENLQLGVKGDLAGLRPGHRIWLTMGGDGLSRFVYRAVLLDSPQKSHSEPFLKDFWVFLVPKTRAHYWIFSSEEGQWMVLESSRAARLIMVFLDSSDDEANMDELQKDLSPLVKQLEPRKNASGAEIQFHTLNERLKKRKLICQVTSSFAQPIIVDEVVYEKIDDGFLQPSQDLLFRRLTFQGSQISFHSQALLKEEESSKVAGKKKSKNTHSSKSRTRGNQRSCSSYELKVDHDYLDSPIHAGMISGFGLISSYLERLASTGQSVKATIIDLGAGLLPMFLHRCLPFMHIEVVEIEPVVRDLARGFFSFREDEHLKPDDSPTVPKFGDWDDNDPASGEGLTQVFERVSQEKHSGGGKVPAMANDNSYASGQKCYGNDSPKACCCFPWGGK